MNETEQEIMRFYNDNLTWLISEYDGDLKPETITKMAIEWTLEDCTELITNIVKKSFVENP